MKYRIIFLITAFVAFSAIGYGHGDEKLKKPEKVSTAMMQEGGTQAAEDKVAERDFDTIRTEVQSSTTFIVIKALALAVAIIGVGAVYLPRKSKGIS